MGDTQALHAGPHPHAFEITQGTEYRVLLIETDDLGEHVVAGAFFHLAQIADTRLRQAALQQHAVNALDATAHCHRRKTGQ